ncbi:DUF4097 family beta strand repeat-containing protein [Paenibacillus tarimensis]|uniref:DUF4097 family beta strand repeat-containing protein n=1 Tax=Paenibacillus tarimensis TaxID=416012 RepID=UPI001F42C220|nr:DUF4097 family beta strand repeat-containing protein [Paenibacillus tarimensis]MCF2945033.1 DUF4097 domain-containing protein [Paenibacillus tarimensis]
MKKSVIIGLLLVIAGVMGAFTTFSGKDNILSFGGKEVNLEKSVPAAEVRSILVNSGGTDIRVIRGRETGTIRMNLEGEASGRYLDDMELSAELSGDGTLEIKPVIGDNFVIGLSVLNVTLTVQLPEQLWDQVEVSAGSGDITVKDVQASRALIMHTGSGNIEAEMVAGETVDVRSGSGDQELDGVNGKRMVIDAGSGNITVASYKLEELAFLAGSGNVRLVNGSARLTGEAGSGNIRYEADKLEAHVRLIAGSGNVTVRLLENPQSLLVDFKTSSGDREIGFEGMQVSSQDEEGDITGSFGSGEIELHVETGSGNFLLGPRS